jgi:hypothetical protein
MPLVEVQASQVAERTKISSKDDVVERTPKNE